MRISLALFLVNLAGSASAQGLTARWERVEPATPPARNDYALTYDDLRSVTVLFGGRTVDGVRLNDTWEFDGVRWKQASASGPAARDSARMVFDANKQVCVLFGGFDSQGRTLGDTWEYDGRSWGLVATDGPSPRGAVAFAYHATAGEAVLYGGWDGAPLADTWRWNGASWSPIDGISPDLRYSVDMCYDIVRQVCVLTGTRDENPDPDPVSVWEWNGGEWAVKWVGGVGGPFAGVGHGLAYDRVHEVSTLIGWRRFDIYFESATFEWNGTGWADADDAPLRVGQALAFDWDEGVAVLPGTTQEDATWTWDGKTWSVVHTGAPPGGGGQALAYDEARKRAVLYAPQLREFDGESWALSDEYGARVRLAGLPHSAVPVVRYDDRGFAYDRERAVCVVFGKTCLGGGSVCTSFTAEWDGRAWRSESTGDPPRDGPAMAGIPGVGVVRFGGDGSYGESTGTGSDLWRWDGRRWSEYPLSGERPSGRSFARMAYDEARSVLVLFGGLSADGALGDLWEWDGQTWTQRDVAGPAARYAHVLVYDAAARRTLLFGGRGPASETDPTAIFYDDVWSWNGIAWARVETGDSVGPSARARAAAAYDRDRGETLIVAGDGGSVARLDDVWRLIVEPGHGGPGDDDDDANGDGDGQAPLPPCAAAFAAPFAGLFLWVCGRRYRRRGGQRGAA